MYACTAFVANKLLHNANAFKTNQKFRILDIKRLWSEKYGYSYMKIFIHHNNDIVNRPQSLTWHIHVYLQNSDSWPSFLRQQVAGSYLRTLEKWKIKLTARDTNRTQNDSQWVMYASALGHYGISAGWLMLPTPDGTMKGYVHSEVDGYVTNRKLTKKN